MSNSELPGSVRDLVEQALDQRHTRTAAAPDSRSATLVCAALLLGLDAVAGYSTLGPSPAPRLFPAFTGSVGARHFDHSALVDARWLATIRAKATSSPAAASCTVEAILLGVQLTGCGQGGSGCPGRAPGGGLPWHATSGAPAHVPEGAMRALGVSPLGEDLRGAAAAQGPPATVLAVCRPMDQYQDAVRPSDARRHQPTRSVR
jgi:hypothetical protein